MSTCSCTVRVTIFSNSSIIPTSLKFMELHILTLAACSYAFLVKTIILFYIVIMKNFHSNSSSQWCLTCERVAIPCTGTLPLLWQQVSPVLFVAEIISMTTEEGQKCTVIWLSSVPQILKSPSDHIWKLLWTVVLTLIWCWYSSFTADLYFKATLPRYVINVSLLDGQSNGVTFYGSQ